MDEVEKAEEQKDDKNDCGNNDIEENDSVLFQQEEAAESEDKTIRELFLSSVRSGLRCSLDSHLTGMLKRTPMARRRSGNPDSIGIGITPRKSITWAQKLESIREFKKVTPSRIMVIINRLKTSTSCRTGED